jgi:hypothetical protein
MLGSHISPWPTGRRPSRRPSTSRPPTYACRHCMLRFLCDHFTDKTAAVSLSVGGRQSVNIKGGKPKTCLDWPQLNHSSAVPVWVPWRNVSYIRWHGGGDGAYKRIHAMEVGATTNATASRPVINAEFPSIKVCEATESSTFFHLNKKHRPIF